MEADSIGSITKFLSFIKVPSTAINSYVFMELAQPDLPGCMTI